MTTFRRSNLFFKPIALILACLFFLNDLSFAAPDALSPLVGNPKVYSEMRAMMESKLAAKESSSGESAGAAASGLSLSTPGTASAAKAPEFVTNPYTVTSDTSWQAIVDTAKKDGIVFVTGLPKSGKTHYVYQHLKNRGGCFLYADLSTTDNSENILIANLCSWFHLPRERVSNLDDFTNVLKENFGDGVVVLDEVGEKLLSSQQGVFFDFIKKLAFEYKIPIILLNPAKFSYLPWQIKNIEENVGKQIKHIRLSLPTLDEYRSIFQYIVREELRHHSAPYDAKTQEQLILQMQKLTDYFYDLTGGHTGMTKDILGLDFLDPRGFFYEEIRKKTANTDELMHKLDTIQSSTQLIEWLIERHRSRNIYGVDFISMVLSEPFDLTRGEDPLIIILNRFIEMKTIAVAGIQFWQSNERENVQMLIDYGILRVQGNQVRFVSNYLPVQEAPSQETKQPKGKALVKRKPKSDQRPNRRNYLPERKEPTPVDQTPPLVQAPRDHAEEKVRQDARSAASASSAAAEAKQANEFDKYLETEGLAQYEELRKIFDKDDDETLRIKKELLEDPALRPVFLLLLPPAQLGPLEAIDNEVVKAIGGVDILHRHSVILPGSPEHANELAKRGHEIIVGVTDRYSEYTLHPLYTVASNRQVYFPLKDGTWLGVKGIGQLKAPNQPPYFLSPIDSDRQMGMVVIEEAQRAEKSREVFRDAKGRRVQFLGYRKLKVLPYEQPNLVQTASLKDPDGSPVVPVLVFNRTIHPHRLVKLPQLLDKDYGLKRLAGKISATLVRLGYLPANTRLSPSNLILMISREMGVSEAENINHGWYKYTTHSQDFNFAGEEHDNEEYLDKAAYTSRVISGDENLETEDKENLTRNGFGIAGVKRKVQTLINMIMLTQWYEPYQIDNLFPSRLGLLKEFFTAFFKNLDDQYLRYWAIKSYTEIGSTYSPLVQKMAGIESLKYFYPHYQGPDDDSKDIWYHNLILNTINQCAQEEFARRHSATAADAASPTSPMPPDTERLRRASAGVTPSGPSLSTPDILAESGYFTKDQIKRLFDYGACGKEKKAAPSTLAKDTGEEFERMLRPHLDAIRQIYGDLSSNAQQPLSSEMMAKLEMIADLQLEQICKELGAILNNPNYDAEKVGGNRGMLLHALADNVVDRVGNTLNNIHPAIDFAVKNKISFQEALDVIKKDLDEADGIIKGIKSIEEVRLSEGLGNIYIPGANNIADFPMVMTSFTQEVSRVSPAAPAKGEPEGAGAAANGPAPSTAARRLIDEAWAIIEDAFPGVTTNINTELLAMAINEHKPMTIPTEKIDKHLGFIFSEMATFGDKSDGLDAQGLGIVLPKLAMAGIRVAVLLSKDPNDHARQEMLIRELNRKINPDKPESDEKRIRFGISREEVNSQFADLKDDRPARFYYLKISKEPEINGATPIDIIVKDILEILGRLCGIIKEGQEPDKLYEAASKFARAA